MASNHKKDKAVVGGKVKFIVLFRNWAHQGFTYLDKTEKFYRIIWEIIPFVVCVCVLFPYIHFGTNILISFFIAHTLNWMFNDNFWTCIQFTLPNLLNPGNDKTKEYLSEMQERMQKSNAVSGCMIYGSLSRGVWKEKSDLDVRILRRPGIINGFKAYWVCWIERLTAVKDKQPLDIYVADGINFLKRMRADEYPIFLKGEDERLIKIYGSFRIADLSSVNSLNELAKKNSDGENNCCNDID